MKEYKQQDLFTQSGKVKKIDTIFEIELEDGSKLRVSEEDAKKIYDGLYKTFGYKYPYYYPITYPSPNPYVPTVPWSPTWTSDGTSVPIIGGYGTTTATYSYNDSEGNIHSKEVYYPSSSGNNVFIGARDYPFESN
jgi:hypothetical protein